MQGETAAREPAENLLTFKKRKDLAWEVTLSHPPLRCLYDQPIF